MAEEEEHVSNGELPHKLPPPFVEVICKTSEKSRRFAAGTDSGFAVSLINRKLGARAAKPVAVYIEAAKEGEEPVNFGPNALLVDYGAGWKLQTVTEVDLSGNNGKGEEFQPSRFPSSSSMKVDEDPGVVKLKKVVVVTKPISFLYIAKIITAFLLIFVIGAIFTLALEYLPVFIMLLNSFM